MSGSSMVFEGRQRRRDFGCSHGPVRGASLTQRERSHVPTPNARTRPTPSPFHIARERMREESAS